MDPEDTRVLIGKRIADLRKALGFTQKSLGDAAGMEREVVNQIENGKNQLRSNPKRVMLAKAFGLTLEEIGLVIDGKLPAEAAAALAMSRRPAATPSPVEA